jgi:hypothetical protein
LADVAHDVRRERELRTPQPFTHAR